MHPLSLVLILFAPAAAALPATPATPTSPPPTSTGSPQQSPPEPFLPTSAPISTDIAETNPTPTPIYSTLTPKVPSNSSSPVTNSTAPCASRRPLRLGPARLHRKPSQNSVSTGTLTPAAASTSVAVPAVAIAVAAAAETPTDSGPRDYASLIPPAPGVTPRPEPNLAQMGYYQTTYYSCVTQEASVHCGWHRPIMVAPANNAAGSTATGWGARIWMLVAGVVGILVAG
ncbi:hypothetical protein CI238_09475 [Colletotrichum incanum]|uniref:Uncharacterized protein n=1 Tax=Colletotrichum incanum TaxID=1573173 RepID=A0A166L801_COLIC|nr:hypothetical protein CI238_09475 [Colletotrichum incanum]